MLCSKGVKERRSLGNMGGHEMMGREEQEEWRMRKRLTEKREKRKDDRERSCKH